MDIGEDNPILGNSYSRNLMVSNLAMEKLWGSRSRFDG